MFTSIGSVHLCVSRMVRSVTYADVKYFSPPAVITMPRPWYLCCACHLSINHSGAWLRVACRYACLTRSHLTENIAHARPQLLTWLKQ